MSNKILVLGATGNIGSFLVQELQKKNADFITGVPARDRAKLSNVGVESAEVDFSDTATLDAAMAGIDTVFMLLPAAENMVNWATNIVASALKQHVGFIIRSSLIDAHPDSPYFLFNIHGRIDQIVRDSGLRYSIVHPNAFMQNFVAYYADAICNDNAFYFSQDRKAQVSYVDVRDIAAVDAEILSDPIPHDGIEYTVTGPEALTCDDIAAALSQAAGRDIEYIPLDREQYAASLQKIGMNEWSIKAFLSLDDHTNDNRQSVVTDDVRRLTHRAPIDFRKFASDYARAWKKVPVKV
ncbi:MAG: NmrA family NAD(P)-binding protein [Deltaproteobacteria bacterium]